MGQNIAGMSYKEAQNLNLEAISVQLESIEDKLDTSIKDRKSVTTDHEYRIRLLEQRQCPYHDALEDSIKDLKEKDLKTLKELVSNMNTDFKVGQWKFVLAIIIASAVGSGGIDAIIALLT